MIGAKKLRVALGLVFVMTLGPAAVSDALPLLGRVGFVPRMEYPDNGAYLTWNANGMNGAGSSYVPKPNDPLGFFVSVSPPPPGSNMAFVGVELINHSGGEIRFPGGLLVPVVLRSGSRTSVAVLRNAATSLAPGASLRADTTTPLPGFGQYVASAFTVAQFATP
jgi:hypothetical protein